MKGIEKEFASAQGQGTRPFPANVRKLEDVLAWALTLCVGTITLAGAGAALGNQVKRIERSAILQALEKNRCNKTAETAAAERLGVSFRALRYRIKKLGIE